MIQDLSGCEDWGRAEHRLSEPHPQPWWPKGQRETELRWTGTAKQRLREIPELTEPYLIA